MAKPLTICALINLSEVHASYYYRLQMPLQTMERLNLPVQIMVDPLTADVPSERRAEAWMWSDIVWMYQATDPLMRRNIQVSKQRPGVKQGEHVWLPPNYIVDSDDNMFHVHPLNPSYRRLGVVGPDGMPLNPHDEEGNPTKIVCENAEGKVVYTWEHGQNGFNITENITRLEDYRSLCQAAGTMTCTTPRVEQYIKEEIGPETRTFVNPNCVRFDHYDDVHLAPHKGVRIMWQGSNTHYDDLFRLKDALQNVMRRYPEAELIMWGMNSKVIKGDIPDDRYRHIPWLPYDQYHLKMVHIGADICLAPLSPTRFNDSRSAIKWYEASLTHDPAVTLAQRSGAYQDEMEDGKTGLLFDTPEEFEEKLSLLIENTKLRRELAANAKDWVHENRDAFKVVPRLYEFFMQLREEKLANSDPSKYEIVEEPDGALSAEQPDLRAG